MYTQGESNFWNIWVLYTIKTKVCCNFLAVQCIGLWALTVRTRVPSLFRELKLPQTGSKEKREKERVREVCYEIHFQIYFLWHNILYSENMRIYICINLYFFKCKFHKGRDHVSFFTSHETQLELNKYW